MLPGVLSKTNEMEGAEGAARRDMRLVSAAQSGSGTAFEELQNLYSRRLYIRIFSMTRNREDAEDALQDTFLRAYVALDAFEGRCQFASWLTRIAINTTLMLLRKRRTRAEVFFEFPVDLMKGFEQFDVRDFRLNPEQIFDQRQRCHSALDAVHKLDPKLRAVLSVWVKEESSVKEVAKTLDLSLATFKSRLHRARQRLRSAPGFTASGRDPSSLAGAMVQ